ncbi:hypothetical protein LINGRAHAP2_LOCUS6283 [Linum grandiflorum]
MNTALTHPRPFLNLPLQSPSFLELRRPFFIALSSHNSSSTSPLRFICASANRITSRQPSQTMFSAISQPDFTELSDESDFDQIATPSGLISICGFGSLLSVKVEQAIVVACVQIPAFMERELEFRFLAVGAETLDGKPFDAPAVLCARYTDEEFFHVRCKGSKDVYFQHYGRYDIDKIWRDDILPCRVYMRHCVLAAKNLCDEAYNNFLDHTFLGNRRTTIRDYLATTGAGIMEEEPPLSLRTRYGG